MQEQRIDSDQDPEEVLRYNRAKRIREVSEWVIIALGFLGAAILVITLAMQAGGLLTLMNEGGRHLTNRQTILSVGLMAIFGICWGGIALVMRWWRPYSDRYRHWYRTERQRIIKLTVIDDRLAQQIDDALEGFEQLPAPQRPKA